MRRKSVLVVLLFMVLVAFSRCVDADSGWDSSYDSGGSWDSGSSWDYDSGSYSSGVYVDGDDDIVGIIIFIVAIIIVVVSISNRYRGNGNNVKSYGYVDLSDDKIREIDASIDKEKLKQEVFEIYKNVQESWMNFDFDNLRKYTTDELYNMYNSQLKVLKAKKQKNIMKDIVYKNAKVVDINIDNGIEKIIVYLNVEQYDYVVDTNDKVVRGVSNYKNNVDYLITVTRSMKNNSIDKCPNCGAKIDIISGGVCPYCDSTIINSTDKFVMSKKECINQRRI